MDIWTNLSHKAEMIGGGSPEDIWQSVTRAGRAECREV